MFELKGKNRGPRDRFFLNFRIRGSHRDVVNLGRRIAPSYMSPNAGGRAGGGGGCGVLANEYSCTHGAQINFGDLTPYLTMVLMDKVETSYSISSICHLKSTYSFLLQISVKHLKERLVRHQRTIKGNCFALYALYCMIWLHPCPPPM